MKKHIEQLISTALDTINLNNDLVQIVVEPTKDKQHGDYASNVALVLAKTAKLKPRDLAETIMKSLPASEHIAKVEIAGPGFINFYLVPQALASVITDILKEGESYGHCQLGEGKKVLVEFVSSNPTGPLHVGHGRHAVFGDVVSGLLATIGYKPHREYYVNDAGRQMDILAVSVWLRYLGLLGEKFPFPSNGYQGTYVTEMAEKLLAQENKNLFVPSTTIFTNLPVDGPEGDKEIYIDAIIEKCKTQLGKEKYKLLSAVSLKLMMDDIREDLADFGVKFDKWFSENELAESDVVDRMIESMVEKKLVYEREGALWFRSTDFDDDKDRVLQRANGQRTYFANDLAYHINKFERGFDSAIDIFGSDHHGYVPRMHAGLIANGYPANKLTYLLLQFVHLYRGGQQAQMSTRSGSFVTLRELREEVGNDAARYFYVMRRCEQGMDFDLDLAKSQTNENPVYYVQYAYARICSVHRQLHEKNLKYDESEGLANLTLLTEPQETQLLSTLARYKDMIISAATHHEPHQLTNYLRDLATDFHSYYNSLQFIVEDSKLRNTRITLINAVRQILANGLQLLGVSTPETM